MKLSVHPAAIPGVLIVENEVYEDPRGFFMEVFREDVFREHAALGLPDHFVQLNHSRSVRGVTRGLHFQWDPPMGKVMRVTMGSAFLVAVDIRKNSPTLGQWFGLEVSDVNRRLVWAPAGFARGLCALSDFAEVQYKCTAIYSRTGESGIRFDDPDIGIQWPEVGGFILSDRDRNAQRLAQWLASPASDTFQYEASPTQ